MLSLSLAEENYLKAIYVIQHKNEQATVSVNDIAERVNTRPATVTDMLKKLSDKKLIHYEKYKKTQLSATGLRHALQIVRKHRLWEVFLNKKLNFSWDEVHDVAEQLEHIRSAKLIEKLDAYLGYPQFDPHGDPIPNAKGEITPASTVTLAGAAINSFWNIVAVKETGNAFLQHLEKIGIAIGTKVLVKDVLPFDGSVQIQVADGPLMTISEKIALNLMVQEMPKM